MMYVYMYAYGLLNRVYDIRQKMVTDFRQKKGGMKS